MTEAAQLKVLSPMQQAEVEKRLRQAAKENRVSCSIALAIAKHLGIPPGEIGRVADRLKIKISKCQLGCF